jgi:DNA-binding PadR family transcriptional regulator
MAPRIVVKVRDLQRGAVRLHILHHANEHPITGAWMSDELSTHGYSISPGTLYPTLHRMEANGELASRKQVTAGRATREYTITRDGQLSLAAGRKTLRELAREVLGDT